MSRSIQRRQGRFGRVLSWAWDFKEAAKDMPILCIDPADGHVKATIHLNTLRRTETPVVASELMKKRAAEFLATLSESDRTALLAHLCRE